GADPLTYHQLAAGLDYYQNPVVAHDAPDPSVVESGGTYYAFSTASNYVNIPLYTSADLSHWTAAGEALPALPSWTTPGRTWAPGVMAFGDHWVMYYATAETASGLQCISRATAHSPDGPYVDDSGGPFICQRDQGGSIDPYPFRDPLGRVWLYWKTNGAGSQPARIWASALTSDGAGLTGALSVLVSADRSVEGGVVENPSMVAVGNGYDLLYSQNQWESASYAVGYAVCSTPAGPCSKPAGPPVMASKGTVLGPGGESVFEDADGNSWLVYHAWTSPATSYAAGGARTLRVDKLGFDGSTPVVAGPTTGRTFLSEPQRIAGDNRFATAAAVSAAHFDPGVPVVYVATGLSYPDALAAGPAAAAGGGPILLVSPQGVPSATAAELRRLSPGRIVVLGGPAAVSGSVMSQLATYAPVSRVAGADRYATAAAVSAATFAPGAPVAYVATGASYADALAGSAAAGAQHGPVLLVSSSDVPQTTSTELQRLKPGRIVVLGGTSALSSRVYYRLSRLAPSIKRLSGSDRYGTAAAVAGYAFSSNADEVLVATGASYPDALAASAVAHPVVLAPPSGRSQPAAAALSQLSPQRIVPVGGAAALPDSALLALA
ncbi:MAG TPA: cell wall-binding repeat-containing protein, partial [Acidimicrobiales bacterium]|nr:cell wall-binding repeat-containing protein [Acidimicrobiales bacterium]